MNTSRIILIGLALAAGLGCQKRSLMAVNDGPQGSTIVETVDSKTFLGIGSRKYVYWECTEGGPGLVCERACGVKNDQGEKIACRSLAVVEWR